MKIVTAIFLVALFASCEQASERVTSTPKGSATEVKSNSYTNTLTITDSNYVLNLNGVKDTFETVVQIRKTLEMAVDQGGKDTLYIYMNSTIANRMREVSPMLTV